MSFAEAYDLFDDESLDFIYIDGYAHTGQEGGETIWQWARKVKIGGLISGDDYHNDWPLVIEAVDTFARETGFDLCVTTEVESVEYAGHPSWAMVKTVATAGAPPPDLLARGKANGAKVAAKRRLGQTFGIVLKSMLPEKDYARLRTWNHVRKQKRHARRTAQK